MRNTIEEAKDNGNNMLVRLILSWLPMIIEVSEFGFKPLIDSLAKRG